MVDTVFPFAGEKMLMSRFGTASRYIYRMPFSCRLEGRSPVSDMRVHTAVTYPYLHADNFIIYNSNRAGIHVCHHNVQRILLRFLLFRVIDDSFLR